MIYAVLLLLQLDALLPNRIYAADSIYTIKVKESATATVPDIELHTVDPVINPVKKLKCHHPKTLSNVDEIVWQYKRCGSGLDMTACEKLSKDVPWQLVLCRNQTKLCTAPTLPIANPSESDSGFYRCLHKNYMIQEYRVNRTIQLKVHDPKSKSIEIVPESEHLDNQTVFENHTAVLRCRVRSTIHPSIAWIRFTADPNNQKPNLVIDGIPHLFLNGSVIHEGPDKLYTSKLYIPRTKLVDAGPYICYAIGANGNATKEVFLNIVPLLSSFVGSSASEELWWFTLAMIVIASICFVVAVLIFRRKRPKAILVPTDDVDVPVHSIC